MEDDEERTIVEKMVGLSLSVPSIAEIKGLCQDQMALARAQDVVRHGIIDELAFDKGSRQITARVQAVSMSGFYHVNVRESDGKWSGGRCECQAARTSHRNRCKHVIA